MKTEFLKKDLSECITEFYIKKELMVMAVGGLEPQLIPKPNLSKEWHSYGDKGKKLADKYISHKTLVSYLLKDIMKHGFKFRSCNFF